ncbi:MAG TPA: trehalase family glycosidase, partial [Flavisolibacter sp.]
MKWRAAVLWILVAIGTPARSQALLPPDQLYGELFADVQQLHVFADSKTFTDCIPKKEPRLIVEAYRLLKKPVSRATLQAFVRQHFKLPDTTGVVFTQTSKDVRNHIRQLWQVLQRPQVDTCPARTWWCNGSLLPLPGPYIVPGGRFREIYYWDSYFTMLGPREDSAFRLMEHMVENFAALARKHGFIPNGNRTYYLSRSQPPFFSMMVSLLASVKGDTVYTRYLDALKAERSYWSGRSPAAFDAPAARTVVTAPGAVRNISRYWDDKEIPRQESHREDVATESSAVRLFMSEHPGGNADSFSKRLYRHIRAAAASGWDFSSRWLSDKKNLETIRTLDIAPVDLNCLLFFLDQAIARAHNTNGEPGARALTDSMPLVRRKFRELYFNDSLGWFCDYDLESRQIMDHPTLAGMFPLFFGLADSADAARAAVYLQA